MKTCPLLTTAINFEPSHIKPCCVPRVKHPAYPFAGGNFTVDEYREFLSKTLAAMQNENAAICSGCPTKTEEREGGESLCDYKYNGNTPSQNLQLGLSRILLNHFQSICNSKCSYCCWMNNPQITGYKILPILKQLADRGLLASNASYIWGGRGEVTTLPEFEDTVSWIAEQGGIQGILTNGIIYSKEIENLLARDAVSNINISLDSGTRGMYRRIKGVDKFDTVCNNIKNYVAKSVRTVVSLKFIIIETPDNRDDIDNFFAVCKKLGIVEVLYSIDLRINPENVQERTLEAILYFEKMAKFHNIRYGQYIIPGPMAKKITEYRNIQR